ncbi:hypothetical protein JCM11491_003798 [Sporobolomyces phaffii]
MPGKHDLPDAEDGSSAPSTPKRARRRSRRDPDGDGSPLPNSTPPPVEEDEDDGQQGRNNDDDQDAAMSDIEGQDQAVLDEMRATQAARSANQRIAEAGVITNVKLENFMCHYLTEVDFGPQVNFLVGVNGSGKSAVLTGITMALGGNAKATNRGTKGTDLIRENQPSARCSVTLANRGEDAFKPDVYGDEITIERTIHRTGSGGYKLKNEDGKTVDTKKATLDSILDHFNLQVDNPMTVLTQDQSRQFLAKASAKDKYNFFLRGTQLAQLTEEYEQIRANTETMEEALQRKREIIPELKQAYQRAKERAKEAKAAMAQQANLGLLKDQLVWSYVAEVENQIEFADGKIAEEAGRGSKFDSDLSKLQDELNAINGEIDLAKEAEAESRNAVEGNRPELEALKDRIKQNKIRLEKWKNDERLISTNLRRHRSTLHDLEQQIATEEAALSRDIEAERAPIRAAIETANEELVKIDIHTHRNEQEIEAAIAGYRQHSEEYVNVNGQIATAQGQAEHLRGRVNNVRQAARNKLLKYGPAMPQLVQAIANERGWKGNVVGPMGLHVQLNHGEYAKALDSFFNHYLNGFVCENIDDVRRVRALMKRANVPGETPVLCAQFDPNFERDLATGEPDPSILTVLRSLTITNPLVRQALINANQVEKIALVPRRPDGDTLMRTDPRNVSRAFSADMYSLRHSNGKSSSISMTDWRGPPRLQADPTQHIAAMEQDIRKIELDIQELMQKKQQVGQLAQSAEQKRRSLEREIRELQGRKRKLENANAVNTEKLTEEQPNNISALNEAKRDVEAEIENISAQYAAGLANKTSQDEDLRPVVDRSNELQNEIAKAENLAAKIAAHLGTLYGKVASIDLKVQRSQTDKEAHLARLAKYNTEADAFRETLKEREDQANSICERPAPAVNKEGKRKDTNKLEREIEAIERALSERAKRQGATVEQILEELETRKKVAQEAVQQTNDLGRLVNSLEEAYSNRTSKWTDFRSHICTRAKMQFGFHLSNRGYHGKLKFDHEHSELHLTVQTDGDKGEDKSIHKDASSLSGGEKSFSTICLLLTMWEAVGCPLRCLDEFDVFMDAVNRRIAMTMMIDTAKSAHQTQFILITPQEMGSIAWGPEVKVVKMGDPKRTKGALAAGR